MDAVISTETTYLPHAKVPEGVVVVVVGVVVVGSFGHKITAAFRQLS